MARPLTSYEKIWDAHVVDRRNDGTCLLYIDRHLVHEVTSPQAFEDLRAAASVASGRRAADGVRAMVVPGSGLVKRQAEVEGLDRVFAEAGFEWREPGCSMCLAITRTRCRQASAASTSNRNFVDRQGPSARTHFVLPAMVAAAVTGRLADVRELMS